ncbi:MAG: DUF1295 domain-containing protein [Ilumatobacteraceae bacterium]
MAYVVAVGVGWVVADACGADRPVLALGLGYVASALAIWVWSMALDNGSMFDPWWSVLPPVGATWLAVQHDAAVPAARVALVLVVVWLWGLRLTSNWARDWPGLHHEDWRYLDLYTKLPKPLISLFGVHLFPCAVVFLGSIPLVPSLVRGTRGISALDVLALVLGLAASVIEFVADEQMRRFRRTKQPGQVMDRGMWKWSRHPNYFGELCVWWSLWLFGLAASPSWWWTVVGPLALMAMFLFASIPMLDARSAERRPEFAAYAARTRRLVPLPRRA